MLNEARCSIKKPYSIILSIDLAERDKILDLCRKTAPFIDGVKIGITSSMVPGIEIISRVKETLTAAGEEKPVLADYKIADIGFSPGSGSWSGTNCKIISRLGQAGADYITCHLFPGLASIEEAVAAAAENGCGILTLPFMTHAGADLFFSLPLGEEQRLHIIKVLTAYTGESKAGFESSLSKVKTVTDAVLLLGDLYNTAGFIGPGNNPEVLMNYRSWTEKEIWCPGFGRQDRRGRAIDRQIKEWAEVCGPSSAMIVGSYIYNADDPAGAAEEIRNIRDREVEII